MTRGPYHVCSQVGEIHVVPHLGQLMDPALLFRMRVLLKEARNALHGESSVADKERCLVLYQQIYGILRNIMYIHLSLSLPPSICTRIYVNIIKYTVNYI